MASISGSHLVDAVLHVVERMTLQQREQLAEEVRAQQPNLFLSLLVLQRYGATLEQLEVMLNLLLVSYEAMKRSSRNWPLVSQEVHSRCLAQVCERLRFKEALTLQLQARAASDAVGEHAEQPLLAYVFGKLEDNGLLGVKTEAEKMLMLAALNLVECIAETAPPMTR